MLWTQRASGSVERASSGRYRGTMPAIADLPRRSPVLGDPHADRGDADREAIGFARPRTDRVQAEATCTGPPVRPARLIPERSVELPRHPVVAALEQRGGVDPGVQDAVSLPRRDHPGADQGRVRLLGEPGTLRLLPGSGRVVRQVDPRPELPVGDAREVPTRPRVADRELDRATRETPAPRRPSRPSRSPRSTNRPFLVPMRSSISAPPETAPITSTRSSLVTRASPATRSPPRNTATC
jgi:hypothetical protein